MLWRPEDWKEIKGEILNRPDIQSYENGIEAGADAMLEKLRQFGNSRGGREENEYRHGTWVFLEDI